jgi:hypothetical protein
MELAAGFGDIAADEPGCAVGVMEEGALQMAAGFGLANLDHGIPPEIEALLSGHDTPQPSPSASTRAKGKRGQTP